MIVESIEGDLSHRFATNSVRILGIDRTLHLTTRTQLAFLVGGFATSPWLSEQLEKRLLGIGLKICKPDTPT